MAAVVKDRRPSQREEQIPVDAPQFADKSELAAGRGERGVVTAVTGGGALEGFLRSGYVPEDQAGLRLGGVSVVGILGVLLEQHKYLLGGGLGLIRTPCDQCHGGRVDGRVVAAGHRVDASIGGRRIGGQSPACVIADGERLVLLDPLAASAPRSSSSLPSRRSSAKRREASAADPERASASTARCASSLSPGCSAKPLSPRSTASSSSPRRSASFTTSTHSAAGPLHDTSL